MRIMDRGIENENVAIGRVIAAKRRCGLGSRILQEGIKAAKELLGADKIYVKAQTYAKGFYEKMRRRCLKTAKTAELRQRPHFRQSIVEIL